MEDRGRTAVLPLAVVSALAAVGLLVLLGVLVYWRSVSAPPPWLGCGQLWRTGRPRPPSSSAVEQCRAALIRGLAPRRTVSDKRRRVSVLSGQIPNCSNPGGSVRVVSTAII